MKEVADFKVYTKGAGSGELRVQIKGPSMRGLFQLKQQLLIFFSFNQCCIVKLFSLNEILCFQEVAMSL